MQRLTLIKTLLAEGWINYNEDSTSRDSVALAKDETMVRIYTVYNVEGNSKEIYVVNFSKRGYYSEREEFETAQETYDWLCAFSPRENPEPQFFQVSFKVSRGEDCKLDEDDVRESLDRAFTWLHTSNIKIERVES